MLYIKSTTFYLQNNVLKMIIIIEIWKWTVYILVLFIYYLINVHIIDEHTIRLHT